MKQTKVIDSQVLVQSDFQQAMTLAQNPSSFGTDFVMPIGSPTNKASIQGLTGNHSNMADMALQHATRNSETPPEAVFRSQDAQDEKNERSSSPYK